MKHVFISRPTTIPRSFVVGYSAFHEFLESEGLVPRRLGATDYSIKAQLQAIIYIMDECSGAIILGYPQIEIFRHVRRNAAIQRDPTMLLPTPWNQIEGSLAYGAKLPVLVVAHPNIGGGIFAKGVTSQYVLTENPSVKPWHESRGFMQIYAQWRVLMQESATNALKNLTPVE